MSNGQIWVKSCLLELPNQKMKKKIGWAIMKWQPKILFLAESIGKELARSYIFWRYKRERERDNLALIAQCSTNVYHGKGFLK